jgi:hypothetical protein
VELWQLPILGQCRKVPGYKGPSIGPKISDKHEVNFSEEQMRKVLAGKENKPH